MYTYDASPYTIIVSWKENGRIKHEIIEKGDINGILKV